MLPFLKPEKTTTIIVGHTKPEGGIEMDHEEGEPSHEAQAIAEDLIRAINAKDVRAVAECIDHCWNMAPDRDSGDDEVANYGSAE